METLLNETVRLLNESSIYLLLGFGLAGVLHVVLGRFPNITRRLTGKGNAPVVYASLLGLPMPLCSCSVLPAAVALRARGASRGATASFLISVPETDVVSIAMTYGLLGTTIAVYRPIAGLAIALVTGFAINWAERRSARRLAQNPAPATDTTPDDAPTGETSGGADHHEPHCHDEPHRHSADMVTGTNASPAARSYNWLVTAVRYGYMNMFDDIIKQLLFGIVLAAALVAWLPAFQIESITGGPVLSYLLMVIIGIPVYVCATASTPVAVGLIVGGISPGAALVFLLAGPATNVASILVLRKHLGAPALVLYWLCIAAMSVAFGLGLDVVTGSDFLVHPPAMEHSHASPIHTAATVVFLALILFSLVRRLPPLRSRQL